MKDRYGKEVTPKEFMERWKQGMQSITPYQQAKISLIGIVLIFLGVISGLYITFITKTWWLFLILLGSLFLTSVNALGAIQKYLALKKIYGGIENLEQESTA